MARRSSILRVLFLVTVASCMVGLASSSASFDLGQSASYALFAYAGITNSGATTITGNIGIYPNSANVTGFNTVTLNGQINIANPTALAVQDDLKIAYTYANGLACNASVVSAQMGGTTFPPGVWCFSPADVLLTGAVTLAGPAGSVWIFVITGTFTVADNAAVVISGGANGCGVLFTVAGSSGTIIGSTVAFQGSIIAYAGITVNTGSTVTHGRLFSKTAQISLLSNTIDNSACVAATSSSTGGVPASSSSSSGAAATSSSSGAAASSSSGDAILSSTGVVDSSTAAPSSASQLAGTQLGAILAVLATLALTLTPRDSW